MGYFLITTQFKSHCVTFPETAAVIVKRGIVGLRHSHCRTALEGLNPIMPLIFSSILKAVEWTSSHLTEWNHVILLSHSHKICQRKVPAAERTLNRLLAILDNASHPLHTVIIKQRSLFSGRLLLPKCSTDCPPLSPEPSNYTTPLWGGGGQRRTVCRTANNS